MPFESGKPTPGAGRKGYEIEKEQKERMQKALDRDLALLERIQDGTASEYDQKIFPNVQARILKYLDKLHTTKTATDITSDGESIIPILVKFVNGKDDTNSRGV